jgi:hypothetical protein
MEPEPEEPQFVTPPATPLSVRGRMLEKIGSDEQCCVKLIFEKVAAARSCTKYALNFIYLVRFYPTYG